MESNFNMPKWDAKSVSGKFIMFGLLGGIGLLVWSKVVPFLANVVWNTVSLGIGIVVAGFLALILTNKKFWRGLNYLSMGIAQWTLGMAIEMNPFMILYNRVEKKEKDIEELREQSDKLKGQEADLRIQVGQNKKIMKDAEYEIKVASDQLRKGEDFDVQLALETSTTTYNNAADFVQEVEPLLTNIIQLSTFADKAYRKAGNALQNAKSTIASKKAQYEAVTTGSNAMKKAMQAFMGDNDLNNDADLALEKLRKDISGKLGVIRGAIQITSQFMNQQDLRDAGKVRQAIESANSLNIDNTLADKPLAAIPLSSNKFAEYLKR